MGIRRERAVPIATHPSLLRRMRKGIVGCSHAKGRLALRHRFAALVGVASVGSSILRLLLLQVAAAVLSRVRGRSWRFIEALEHVLQRCVGIVGPIERVASAGMTSAA